MTIQGKDIRPATREERVWAGGLMAASEPWITLGATREQCIQACHHPEHLVFIAHKDGKPSGVIVLDPRGVAGSPYIKSVCVSEFFRSEGIGSSLITFAENLFKADSAHIFLCVSSFNNRGQELYERLGYRKVGELPDYVITGASELLLHKSLR